MRGNPAVIDRLNKLLVGELTSADQYFIHSRMLADWGFHALAARIAHERDDELDHADRLVRRILFLDGRPDVGRRAQMTVGRDVPEMLRSDLAYELAVVADLKDAIALCEAEQDYETRAILGGLLADTEQDHTLWLEQQLRLVDAMGLPNYLQTAADGGSS